MEDRILEIVEEASPLRHDGRVHHTTVIQEARRARLQRGMARIREARLHAEVAGTRAILGREAQYATMAERERVRTAVAVVV